MVIAPCGLWFGVEASSLWLKNRPNHRVWGWGGVCHLSFVALPAVSLEPGTCTVRVRLTSLMVCEPLKAETLAHLSWVPGTVTGPG